MLTRLQPGTSAYGAMIACLTSANLPTSDLEEGTVFFSYAGGMAFGGHAHHGFAVADRDRAPEAIAMTSQFRNLRPASAALTHKRLG